MIPALFSASSRRKDSQVQERNPVHVTDVAREVKAVGGSIWLLDKQPFGFLLRCEVGPTKFRIVVRPISGNTSDAIPYEANSPLHVVITIDELRAWLSSIPRSIQ